MSSFRSDIENRDREDDLQYRYNTLKYKINRTMDLLGRAAIKKNGADFESSTSSFALLNPAKSLRTLRLRLNNKAKSLYYHLKYKMHAVKKLNAQLQEMQKIDSQLRDTPGYQSLEEQFNDIQRWIQYQRDIHLLHHKTAKVNFQIERAHDKVNALRHAYRDSRERSDRFSIGRNMFKIAFRTNFLSGFISVITLGLWPLTLSCVTKLHLKTNHAIRRLRYNYGAYRSNLAIKKLEQKIKSKTDTIDITGESLFNKDYTYPTSELLKNNVYRNRALMDAVLELQQHEGIALPSKSKLITNTRKSDDNRCGKSIPGNTSSKESVRCR